MNININIQTILGNDPNLNIADVDGDLAAVEAASGTGILEQATNNLKAIHFDQGFPYPANTTAQFIRLFRSMEDDISDQGFRAWFNANIDTPGHFMAQAFLLNVYLGTDVIVRDLCFFGRANNSIGLEAQPREIALFYFGLSLWSRRSEEQGNEVNGDNVNLVQELQNLMHVLFPYRSEEWAETMMDARIENEDTVEAILAAIHNNGLIKAIFRFLVGTNDDLRAIYMFLAM